MDNHDLILTLEQAKASAVDIAEKLKQAKVTAKEIDEVRVKYTPAAKRGAVLFFVMAGLANITNMYEYSLASFLTVFTNTLATSKRDASLEGRLRNIIEAGTYDVYCYTCLGLFERHKLMFSFQVRRTVHINHVSKHPRCSNADPRKLQIAAKIMDESGFLNQALLDFFLKGNLSLEKSERKKPYSWFPETGWHDLMRLEAIAQEGSNPALKEVVSDIEKDEYAWKCYYDLEAPETAMLPNGYESRFCEFEKLLLLRCIKMDRVTVRSQQSPISTARMTGHHR